MASMPYFVLSPSAIVCIIGYLRGPDRTVPTPVEDYTKAVIDLFIPAHNEEDNIILCLESVQAQTVKPNKLFIIDDGSTDKTSELVAAYAASSELNIELLTKEVSEGKTPALAWAAKNSTADVLFVLDADTTLRSNNYIERLVQELYQGVGIACACGVVLPEFEKDKRKLMSQPTTYHYLEQFPECFEPRDDTLSKRLQHLAVNNYREELYLFLQKFIYNGEMVFFGSIINPVGCAVAYRRKYLLDVLEHYHKHFGYNLTSSEDIFIGFAFADHGYRNIQLRDVYALTQEPRLSYLYKQIKMWSSAFLQSCYYFDELVKTPFKLHHVIVQKIKDHFDAEKKIMLQKRKIQEQYRQSFHPDVTKKMGRPIGWFVFTSLLEKIAFPTCLIIFVILRMWEAVAFTLIAEISIYTVIIGFMHKNRRIRNMLKSICFAPIRYSILLFDIYVIGNFAKELWITKNRKWRK